MTMCPRLLNSTCQQTPPTLPTHHHQICTLLIRYRLIRTTTSTIITRNKITKIIKQERQRKDWVQVDKIWLDKTVEEEASKKGQIWVKKRKLGKIPQFLAKNKQPSQLATFIMIMVVVIVMSQFNQQLRPRKSSSWATTLPKIFTNSSSEASKVQCKNCALSNPKTSTTTQQPYLQPISSTRLVILPGQLAVVLQEEGGFLLSWQQPLLLRMRKVWCHRTIGKELCAKASNNPQSNHPPTKRNLLPQAHQLSNSSPSNNKPLLQT